MYSIIFCFQDRTWKIQNLKGGEKVTKLYKPTAVLIAGLMILVAFTPAFAVQTATNNANVTVGDTIGLLSYWNGAENGTADLGTVFANNLANNWVAVTPGTNLELNDTSNVPINASVQLNQTFTTADGTHTIPVGNFLFDFNNTASYTAFDNLAPVTVKNNWPKPADGFTDRVPVSLQLTVPYGQASGTYYTKMTWYAVAS